MELNIQVFSTFRTAIVVSIIVYLGIVTLLSQFSFSPTPQVVSSEPMIELTISREEALVREVSQTEVEISEKPAIQPSESIEELVILDEQVAVSAAAEGVRPNELVPIDEAIESTASVISADVLSASIDHFISDYRIELGRESVEACMRYKNRHGGNDCPQFDSAFDQSTNNTGQTLLTLEDMDNLQTLIDNDSIVDTIAKAKYSLERDYSRASDGDTATVFMDSTTSNAIAGDPVLMLAGFDNGGISILAGLLSFGFDGSIKFLGAEPELTLTPFIQDESENYVEKTTTSDFEVATPLFPAR